MRLTRISHDDVVLHVLPLCLIFFTFAIETVAKLGEIKLVVKRPRRYIVRLPRCRGLACPHNFAPISKEFVTGCLFSYHCKTVVPLFKLRNNSKTSRGPRRTLRSIIPSADTTIRDTDAGEAPHEGKDPYDKRRRPILRPRYVRPLNTTAWSWSPAR